MMPAHWSALIAAVPLSVNRSISTSSAGTRNRLYPPFLRTSSRCSTVVNLIGSTDLILNGSMMVFMGWLERVKEEGSAQSLSQNVAQPPSAVKDRSAQPRAAVPQIASGIGSYYRRFAMSFNAPRDRVPRLLFRRDFAEIHSDSGSVVGTRETAP